MRIPSGVTDQYIYFVAVDATDHVTFETGLSSFTVRRSRNGGASAAFTTPTINETDSSNMPGVYELLLDEDMTIDSGDDEQEVCLRITHAGMAPVTLKYTLFRPKITAGETLGASGGDLVGFAAAALAEINAEVLDVMNVDTHAEPTGVPPATASIFTKINRLYMEMRNRVDVTASKKTVYDDGDAAEYEYDLSDNGTTFSKSEANAL